MSEEGSILAAPVARVGIGAAGRFVPSACSNGAEDTLISPRNG